MKNSTMKIGIVSVLLILTVSLFCQTIAEPPINFYDENAGSEDNPFQIGSLANLRWLSETPEVWGGSFYAPNEPLIEHTPYFFIQTADIDASETSEWTTDITIIGFETITYTYQGFLPIGRFMRMGNATGNGFCSNYDGNGFDITNLYMINTPYITPLSQSAQYYGFFAITREGTIKNVNLKNVSFGAKQYAGILVGYAQAGSYITNCHATGSISIIGYNDNFNDIFWIFENSFDTDLGGLVGRAEGCIIENSSAGVTIIDDPYLGWSNIGGLVGDARGAVKYPPHHPDDPPPPPLFYITEVRNCAFYGNISGNLPAIHPILNEIFPYYKAGLIGVVNEFTIIENCIVGPEGVFQNATGLGGFIGTESMMSNSFWDIESSGVADMYSEIDETAVIINNHGLSSIEMKLAQTYIDAGFDFETIWDINPEVNNGYPFINLRSPNVGISDDTNKLDYKLSASNYPNPFNPETSISFNLPTDSNVKIEIYNIKGQKVKSIVNEKFLAGSHSIIWNGTDHDNQIVGSGIYFYKIQTDNQLITNKMLLIK